ncbi:MAG TPA: alpha/beta hydrolase [Microbacteriaceae bacterium]|nr:alpha/beta hydrolase [Microbacteriaceae bacterium]
MNTAVKHLQHGLDIGFSELGDGRPVLVIHGGGGPATVSGIAQQLSDDYRTVTPTLPGWNGASRPDWLTRIDQLATALLELLEAEGLRELAVIGSSIGGWIAAEMAIRDHDAGRITGLVLVDSVGVAIPGQPIRDFFSLDAAGIARYSFADSDRFFTDPTTVPEAQKSAQQANMVSLKLLAGDPYMHDPELLDRLTQIGIPTLVIWGDSDGIVTPAYGRAFADAFAHGRFELVANAGHLPQIEQPTATLELIRNYLQQTEAADAITFAREA